MATSLNTIGALGLRGLAVLAACATAGGAANGDSVETKERTLTDLLPGIHVIRHPDAPDGFPQGNTTVVIGEKGVLVVDACLIPSSARQDIAQIRKWTDKPVLYLVNTHWHFDHTLGNRTYAEAFPNVQIVAHTETRRIIADNNPGAMTRYAGRADRLRKLLDSGKKSDGTPLTDADRKDFEESIAGHPRVVEEFRSTSQLPPNVGFRDQLDIELGNRPVQIRFLGPGNTAGDTVVHLPNEKILMAGDLVVHPVPYMFGGLPVDFVRTLRALEGLGAQVIVPGHGDIQRNNEYVDRVIDLMDTVNREIEKEVNDGLTLEEAQAAAPDRVDVKAWRRKFVGSNEDDGAFFDVSFAGLVKASYNQIKMR